MMVKARIRTSGLLALAILAGCSQSDAPSEEVEKAADQMVQVVEGEPTSAHTASGPYAPRDQCGSLQGAEAFLREVKSAIDEKDADAFVALAAEDIKLDFGGGSGTGELRRRLDDPEDALWDDLSALTTLGCAANAQGGLTLPWYFEQQIPARDPTGAFVVTGEGVPVYNAPGTDAPVVARLSWDAVELVPDGPEYEGYRHVVLIPAPGEDAPKGDALTGYVNADSLRSLIDYRLIAASRNGRWRIISLVAGD